LITIGVQLVFKCGATISPTTCSVLHLLLLLLSVLLQSIQGPRDEILVAFFSKDLKTASPEEKDLVAAVAAQDADAVEEALKHVSTLFRQYSIIRSGGNGHRRAAHTALRVEVRIPDC
jgi:hypothetical protein